MANVFLILLDFHWTQLLQPQWYIENGGLWFILFAVFAETGLFAGFFLPGDSLLFVAGIFCDLLIKKSFGIDLNSSFLHLLILGLIISAAGIIGNSVGYWFGKKSGPFLFQRKDTFLFKKKYLFQAQEFYNAHGASAIVMARFLPIIRTFAPIVAGVVGMEPKKYMLYNIIGCLAWVFTMLFGGHYLQQLLYNWIKFDLKQHLEVIVIGIVLLTTAPIFIKILFNKKKDKINIKNTL